MKWDILILTQPSRREFLDRLQENLEPQVMRHAGYVRVVLRIFDRAMSLGANREEMRRSSNAEYVSFVDDDDLVADNYVDRILPLLDGVDYIGFRLQAYEDGVPLPKPTIHSLNCGGWWENYRCYGRDISHLNPIRREPALRCPMYGGFAEDSRWSGDMRRLEIVKTEHFIEETMYHYLSRTDKTDGVDVRYTGAGACPNCQSLSTVIVDSKIFCNACGRQQP